MLVYTTLVTLLAASASTVSSFKVVKGAGPTFIPGRFIVAVDPSNSTLAKRADQVIASVINNINDQGIDASTKKTFDAPGLLTGASIIVPVNTTAADLLAVPGVQRVWPVRIIPRPGGVVSSDGAGVSTAGSRISADELLDGLKRREIGVPRNIYANDTWSPHQMTGVDYMHGKGFLGAGIRVGIIDTGVDYKNPILGGGFGPGYKIAFGYAFVGDDSSSPPSSDPYTNCSDHGTHVTGIVGANYNSYGFSGVAPQATIGMYRVFSCTGDTGEDTVLEALLRAAQDNCDVINMSLGGSIGWLDGSPTQALVEKLNQQGIVTTTSAGNEQAEGLFFSEFPAATKTGMAIASVDVAGLPAYNMTFKSGGYAPLPYLSAAPFHPKQTLQVYVTSTDSSITNDGCDALPASTPDLTNRLVVIQRGSCDFVTKIANAVDKGARFVIIYNSATGSTMPYIDVSGTGLTAIAGMRREDGLKLLKYYTAQNKKLVVTFPSNSKLVPGVLDTVSGGEISDFSNFGPTNEMYGQPSFATPGGNILSTVPLTFGGVGVLSGTSMAAPFAAGSAAVILSARKKDKLTPVQLRALFSSTAQPVAVKRGTTAPLSTTLLQGGGLLNVQKAYEARSFVSPSELMLNDTAFFNGTQKITIINKNSRSVSYNFAGLHMAAQARAVYDDNYKRAVNPSLDPPALSGSSTVSFKPSRLTIAAGKTATVEVTIKPPTFSSGNLARFPLFGGFISIVADYPSGQQFTVPYFGLAGKMFDMPILDSTALYSSNYQSGLKYPFLSNGSSAPTSATSVTTYSIDTGFTVYFRLAQGTRVYNIDLVNATVKFTPTISAGNNAGLKRRSDLPDFTDEFASLDDLSLDGNDLVARSMELHGRLVTRAAQLYSATPIVGRIDSATEQPRDEAVTGNAGFSDQQVGFVGEYETAPNTGVFATASTGTPYRILLRALKTTGDPKYETSWESWLSPPFKFS